MFELYIKYLLEGIAVAIAAYFIPRKKVDISEVIFIALSAAATFAVLDIFAPKVGDGARKGAGFGIGANTVGWPSGAESFDGSSSREDFETAYQAARAKEAAARAATAAREAARQRRLTPKELAREAAAKAAQAAAKLKAARREMEDFDGSTIQSVKSTVSSAVSTVTGTSGTSGTSDSTSTGTKSTSTKSTDTKSTKTESTDSNTTGTKSTKTESNDSNSSGSRSMDSTGSSVIGYDKTHQFASV